MKARENFCAEAPDSSFGNPRQLRKSPWCRNPIMSTTDKIAGLKEILALDPKNAFARYGIAMELANRGEVEAALKEFDVLIEQNPDYTAAYFMSAQTLAKAGRNPEAVGKLKAGIACAARTGNRHALSEMQGMIDELDQ
jgi:predicted Zn-dependent protease